MANSQSTLPNDEKEAQDSAHNPGEKAYQDGMGSAYEGAGLDQLESFANDPANHDGPGKNADSSDAVREAEDDGGSWKSNYGGNKSKGGRTVTPMNVRAILKKRGPLGLIAILGLGGGLLGTALFSPGLILVHMKEALVSRMNTQLTTMETRTTKVLGLKVKTLTSGVCGSKITIKCRYATMSDKQVKKFEEAGIKVNSTKTGLGGRIKPDSLEFGGKPIDATNFDREFRSNPELRTAFKQVYNPKFGGFTDRVWTRVSGKLGINKTKALPEGKVSEKENALREQTKNGSKLVVPDDGLQCTGDKCEGKAKAAKAAKAATATALEEAAQETAGNAAKEIGDATGKTLKKVTGFLNVTGGIEDACTAYSSVRALGYAAKTVRAVQLAHYAMVFLNAADQIKAGKFSSTDAAYLGGILTNVAYDATTSLKRKAAMDSFGMQYAMFGISGKSDSYVTQFMAGGGLTGDLIAVTDYINVVTNNSPLGTCRTLNNPAVQAGSLAAGIGLMLIPGVGVAKLTVGTVIKGISGIAIQVGVALLPGLLKDIVAGNVLNGIVGEDSGNAIAAGSGKIMSDLSKGGGNGLMSVENAVAYSKAQDQTVAMYAQEDRLTANPFNPNDSNTFVGSIVSKLLPYTFTMGDIGGSLTHIGSFVGSSLGSIIPQSLALSTAELTQGYSSCNDVDYKELGIATDPMCNPIYGIPTQYLGADPNQVVDELVSAGQIDETTGNVIPIDTNDNKYSDSYASYLTNCVNRDRPIGDVGDDFSLDSGKGCIINSQRVANYALYTNDQRVQDGMDGVGTDSNATNATSAYEFYAPNDAISTIATNTQTSGQAIVAPVISAVVGTPMKALAYQFTPTGCIISDKSSVVAPLNYKVAYGIV